MIHTKRGLSDIITNVLIILLVLVAVGIIWGFIRPLISNSASSIQGADVCFSVSVSPTVCRPDGTKPNFWNVTLSRSSGAGSISAVKLIFKNTASGTSRIVDVTTYPNEFETSLANVNLTGFTPNNVDAAVVVSVNGQTKTCEASSSVVTCA